MEFKRIVKSGYDKIADRYLIARRLDSKDVRLLNDFIELLDSDSKILDAGCGAGIPVTQILAEHFDVTGVDFSKSQIERAKKNIPNAHFICADMTRLLFSDNTFDGITSYYAIIHIPREEHQTLLSDIHRMLKPNGLALLCLGAENLIDDIEEDYLGTRMYWSHYDSETYLQMLNDCGFSLIWAEYVVDESCDGAKHLFVLVKKLLTE